MKIRRAACQIPWKKFTPTWAGFGASGGKARSKQVGDTIQFEIQMPTGTKKPKAQILLPVLLRDKARYERCQKDIAGAGDE